MKLIRLRSIANQAVRSSIWGYGDVHFDPLNFITTGDEFTVDLLTGQVTPDREGDDVEKYYKQMSEWFHDVLEKEGIPLNVIESAIIKVLPGNAGRCIIVAQGKTFESFEKWRRRQEKKGGK